MKKSMLRTVLIAVAILAAPVTVFAGGAGETREITQREDGYRQVIIANNNTKFAWKLAGDSVYFELSAPAAGWVAIGLNPTFVMEKADFLIAYVDASGVKARDDFGISAFSHRSDLTLGGTDDFSDLSGVEENGITMVRFSRKLNSGDKFDSVIDPETEQVILLAFSNTDDFTSYHVWKTKLKIKL